MSHTGLRTGALVLTLLSVLSSAGAYTVVKGDTLYSVAKRHGLKVATLRQLNNLSTDTIELGQVLRLSSKEALPATPARALAPAPKPTETALAVPLPAVTTGTLRVGGVSVTLPQELQAGDGFTVRLSGEKAAQAVVRFPSEVGEDVRMPNEALSPYGAAGVYNVPGRVVLGKTTPVVVEIKLGDDVARTSIPLKQGAANVVQHLNLPASISQKLTDPGKAAEDALVNKAYVSRALPRWTRPFAAPISTARVTSSFGSARTYVAGGPIVYHYGADYPARSATPIHAINDGVVVIAGNYPVRGGFVMIDHGAGVTSLYFHQSKVGVKVGQPVKRGDVIGQVGATGLADGAHLHLEVRVRGEATQPSDWFNKLWP